MTIRTTGAQQAIDSVWARAETVLGAGRGQVETSIRRKERGETSKPPHGAAIWNLLRARGHDPGDYDEAIIDDVGGLIGRQLERILSECSRTHRPRVEQAQALMRRVAEALAQWVSDTIRDGRLGQNSGRYARRKEALTRAGVLPATYGIPAPRGIRTGRFLDGIKAGWSLGGRRRHAVRPTVEER